MANTEGVDSSSTGIVQHLNDTNGELSEKCLSFGQHKRGGGGCQATGQFEQIQHDRMLDIFLTTSLGEAIN